MPRQNENWCAIKYGQYYNMVALIALATRKYTSMASSS